MNKLLQRLLGRLVGYLFPGVDDDDAPPADDLPSDDPPADDTPADDLPGDDDLDFDFVEPTPARRTATSDRDRLAALEAEVERRGRIADAGRSSPTPSAPPVDPDFQREEERLRAADITDTERWQIQSNRVLRDNQRLANQALFQAQDLNDRTAFQAKIASDPHRARYQDRVEQALAEERRQGRNASREAIYYHMLGKDIAEGKLKPKAKAKTPAADIPRGRSPGVRSNVQGGGRGATEHQKRAARLEGKPI